ncbi:hypothetical protein BLOT_010052 [Blomia tropicalis]|nr:hypothetical protein BLOT_010052 [Blomia tropicalis]
MLSNRLRPFSRKFNQLVTQQNVKSSLASPVGIRVFHHNGGQTNGMATTNTIKADPHNGASASRNTSAAYVPLTENVFKLNELKVFQDEQIIQLSFKSGLSVNYSMSWLRSLCSCPHCVSNKFSVNQQQSSSNLNMVESINNDEWSVVRFHSTEDELRIVWLDNNQYKTHHSNYNLKYLALYANGLGANN